MYYVFLYIDFATKKVFWIFRLFFQTFFVSSFQVMKVNLLKSNYLTMIKSVNFSIADTKYVFFFWSRQPLNIPFLPAWLIRFFSQCLLDHSFFSYFFMLVSACVSPRPPRCVYKNSVVSLQHSLPLDWDCSFLDLLQKKLESFYVGCTPYFNLKFDL